MKEKYKLFDFVTAINFTKKDLFQDPEAKMDYAPFIINKALSFYGDTVLYANELNQHASLPKEQQFYFYLNSIPKKKRFSEWVNKDKESKSLFGLNLFSSEVVSLPSEVVCSSVLSILFELLFVL